MQSAINSLGTDVIAASSAAFNLEILAYYIINSFAQACTTFVGQNYGAKKMRRCRRTLVLSLLEDTAAAALAIGIVLAAGKPLLSIFNSDPAVISIGYTRLIYIFSGYFFQYAVRGDVGLYARLRNILRTRPADHPRRMRNTPYMDKIRIPRQQNV